MMHAGKWQSPHGHPGITDTSLLRTADQSPSQKKCMGPALAISDSLYYGDQVMVPRVSESWLYSEWQQKCSMLIMI